MLADLIKAHKYKFLIVLSLSILNSFFEVVGLGSFALLLQKSMSSGSHAQIDLGFAAVSIPVMFLPWLCIMFFLVKGAVNLLYFFALGKLVYGTEWYFNCIFFKYYVGRHDARTGDSSELIRRNLLVEVPMFAQNFMQPILNIISELILLASIGCLILFIFSSFWLEMMVGACILAALLVGTLLLTKPLQHLGRHRQYYTTMNIREVSSLANGWKDIKANNLQSATLARYESALGQYAKYMAAMFPLQAAPRVIFEVIIICGFVMGFFYIQKQSVDASIDIAMISIFALSALRIYPSLAKLGSLAALISFARTSYDTLKTLYSEVSEPYNPVLSRSFINNPSPQVPVLEIQNFDLVIPSHDKAITIDHLQVHKGDIVIVKGPNGSGKTTLLDVISAIADQGSGKIIYAGSDGDLPQVKYCTQFPYYTDSPITDQVKFGGDKVDDIKSMLISSGFFDQSSLDKIMNLENAQNLSGGEKIKIACAEILSRDCDLCLLDEPTSPMDLDAIENLKSQIRKKSAAGTAFIIVSHDDSFNDLATHNILVS